jgi:hypothetical protein
MVPECDAPVDALQDVTVDLVCPLVAVPSTMHEIECRTKRGELAVDIFAFYSLS